MPIGDICNREVVTVFEDDPVIDAVRLMRKYHVGSVVIIKEISKGITPIGILTDRDIVIELLADDICLETVPVRSAMSENLLTAHEDDDPMDLIKQMRARGVRRVPIVNQNEVLVGILAVDDLIEIISEELYDISKIAANEERKEEQKYH